MWRTVFCLLIVYGHTSSQPIEDSENARQTRQLDFERCCPCADDIDGALGIAGGGHGSRSRDSDDCPCRPRSADSDGAASVFFPTAVRPTAPVVRPDQRKEEVKPLLHPEVDLASSVLQTIREATDEEYKDALARDAARSVAKSAMEELYGDAAPEASNRNSVTIIVKPKQAEDIMTQESRNNEPRCLHAPLESARTVSKTRNPQKPNLFYDMFGLPRTRENMDSSVDASNVEEHVLRADSDQVPLKKSNSKIGTVSSKMNSEPSIHEKILDFISGRTSLDGKIKTPLPSLPKLKPINSKLNVNSDNGDLSSAPSNIDEVGKLHKKVKAYSQLENILAKSRPLDIKNLLKLKDVELIPLKDLINNAKNQPKLPIASRMTNENDCLDSESLTGESELNDLLNLVPSPQRVKKVEVSDAEVSPSNVIQQVRDGSCENNARNTNSVESEEKIASSEFFNTTPSPLLIESDVKDRRTDVDNSQSSELTDNNSDCDLTTIPASVTDLPLSKERDITYEIKEIKRGDSGTGTFDQLRADDLLDGLNENVDFNKDDFLNDNSRADSMSGASNGVNTIVKPDSGKHDFVDEAVARQTQDSNINVKPLDNRVKPKIFEPITLEKTMDIMKSNIIENIKSHGSGKSNSFGKETIKDVNQNIDTNNDESSQIRSEMGSDEIFETVDNKQISMQDLQIMSDSMLKHENKEKTRSNKDCNIPTQEKAEPNEVTKMKSADSMQDSSEEKMQTFQNEDDMNSQSSVNTNNVKDTCGSNLPQQSKAQDDDTNVGASENVISRVPPRNAVQSIQSSDVEQPCTDSILRSPLHDLSDALKIPPIPTLDEITSRVSNIFDKGVRISEDILPLKTESLFDSSKILEPTMATGASTRNSKSKRPPERFLEDLDILKVKPLPVLPKSKWTDNLGLKSIKLQSPFDNKGLGSGIGRSRSKSANHKTGLSNPLDTINLGDFKARSSSGAHTILKNSLNHDDLLSGRALSDLSENINSHFKVASRNVHNVLESTFNGAKKAHPIQLEPHELLETISRNHEDVSDTLKALHLDFNDRLDTMRSDLLDKTRILASESRTRKPSIKPLGDHNTWLRTSQPTLTTRSRNTPALGLDLPKLKGSSASGKTKFRMPAAASVPVPETVSVPELKMMSKPSGLAPQRTTNTNIHTLRNQGINSKPLNVMPLKKPVKPFRDTKVKVSFSSTPRPRLETVKPHAKPNVRVKQENHDIHSDLRQTKPSTTTGLLNNHKLLNTETDSNKRLSTPLGKPLSKLGTLEHDKNLGSLKSWPKASEGGFLSKVKEAVKARLPPSHLSNTLKQANAEPNLKSTLPRSRVDVTNVTDMSRAASEVVERAEEQVLKQNVTYKCKMVCTQEKK